MSAIRDEVLAVPGKATAELVKRTPVYTVQSAVFVSLVKRLVLEPANSGIVLDCRSREHVQQGLCDSIIRALGAINATHRLPRHNQCTTNDKEAFREWLQINTHLKDVFLFDGSLNANKAMHEGSFLSRVLRYLGATTSKARRVIILAGGIQRLAQNEIAISFLRVPFPLLMVSSAKCYGIGTFVAVTEGVQDVNVFRDTALAFRARHIINVTNRTCDVNTQGTNLMLHDFGKGYLPIKTEEKAIAFYKALFPIIVQAGVEKSSLLILDTSYRGFAAVVVGLTLVEIANLSMVDTLGLLRSRLDPPQFDSYTLAAMSHLSDRSVDSSTRIQRAIECLAAKFKPQPSNSDNEANNSPSKKAQKESEILLKGSHPMSIKERWDEIQAYLEKAPHSNEVLAEIYKFISSVFNNVLLHPDDAKYRRLKMTNPRVNQMLGGSMVARMLMLAGGWEYRDREAAWVFEGLKGCQSLRDVLVYISNA